MPTLGYTHAVATAHQNLSDTAHTLPEGASLNPEPPDAPVACSDAQNPPAGTPVAVTTYATVAGVDASASTALLREFAAYWSGKGWHVTDDDYEHGLYTLKDADGFVLTMQIAAQNNRITVESSTPCVAPPPPP